MKRSAALVLVTCFLFAAAALAGGAAFSVATATGSVDKADVDMLIIKPRSPDGKFTKHLTLTLTGTSKITSLTQQKRAGKLVFVQRDIQVKDLEPNEPIAVIYGVHGKELVLLSAVVHSTK